MRKMVAFRWHFDWIGIAIYPSDNFVEHADGIDSALDTFQIVLHTDHIRLVVSAIWLGI